MDKDRSHIKEFDYFLENILNSNKDNKFSLNAIDANRVPDILSLSVGEDADVFIKSCLQIAIYVRFNWGDASIACII